MCIRQRIGGSNPPLTAIFKMRACTQVRALFLNILRWGDENPRPGFDNWQRQLDRPRACERAAPQGRAKRVNPPLTAIFEMRACTQVRALFFYILRWGDENPRPGFDNWQRQLDRPRACERAAPTKTPGAFLNNACVGPAGARPMDGPSNGERSESIPPHRHILRRARTHVRAFFSLVAPQTSPGSAAMPPPATRPYPPGSPAKRSAAGRMPKNNKARASPGLAHSMTINNRLSASAGREPSARSHRW